jgi:hypothetical protein
VAKVRDAQTALNGALPSVTVTDAFINTKHVPQQHVPFSVCDIHAVVAQYFELTVLLGHLPLPPLEDGDTDVSVALKLSCDGYQATYREGRLLFTLTFVDTVHPHSSTSTFPVALACGPEEGAVLDTVLSSFSDKLRILRDDGIPLTIRHPAPAQPQALTLYGDIFVCADQKALLELLGLNNPTSKFFCPWCDIDKDQPPC